MLSLKNVLFSLVMLCGCVIPIAAQNTPKLLFGVSPEWEKASRMLQFDLRPNIELPFYVFIHNPSNDDLELNVIVTAKPNKKFVVGPLKLKSKERMPVPFKFEKDEALGQARELEFVIEDIKADEKNRFPARYPVKLNIMKADDYLKLEPARLDDKGNMLVDVSTRDSFRGPPCKVELDLSRLNYLKTDQEISGVFKDELDGIEKKSTQLTLERLSFAKDVQQGFFSLKIDDVQRAKAFKAEDMKPRATPVELEGNTIRVVAPPYCKSDDKTVLDLRVEVDYPTDPQSQVEIEIDLAGKGNFIKQPARHYREEKIELKKSSEAGALVFLPRVNDWHRPIRSEGINAKSTFRAHLLNSRGEKIRTDERSTVFSKAPPKITSVVVKENKSSYLPGEEIQVEVVAAESATDIKEVTLYVGENPPGEKDKPAKAILQDGVWKLKMTLPDKPGKARLFITARNGIDLLAVHDEHAFKIAVPSTESAKDKPGSIKGQVLQGTEDRPQREVDVYLLDAKGARLKTTKTNDEGYFEFKDLAAGSYEVVCIRGRDNTKARASVAVEAGMTVHMDNSDEKKKKALYLKR